MSVSVSAQINLVDLAGSEKIRPHQLGGLSDRRLAELTAINQSLSSLGNCIRALGESDRTHIPYRDSKLTRLLQDSLGGNTKTAFIVTLSPAEDAAEETISTLQFADRAKKVVVHVTVNESVDDPSLLRQYQHEIAALKKQLREVAAGQTSGVIADEALVNELRGEVSKAKEETVAALQTLARTKDELLIVKQERSELVKILSASLLRSREGSGAGLCGLELQAC